MDSTKYMTIRGSKVKILPAVFVQKYLFSRNFKYFWWYSKKNPYFVPDFD